MTKEEIEKRIEQLEAHNFRLEMGCWSDRVADIIRKNDNEIRELKKQLEEE